MLDVSWFCARIPWDRNALIRGVSKTSVGACSGAFVRVGVNSGGCSGLSYDLGFDTNENKDDKFFEDNGIKIVVNKKSYLYLIGTILDYSGGLNGKGFVFNNPNASRTCGCGESFAL